jgi:HAD superfamily hydrolase (TIGR01509 family)
MRFSKVSDASQKRSRSDEGYDMPIRGVIFDLDGTLVDTNWFHVEAWRRAFAACGHDVPAETIVEHVGMSGDQLIPKVLGKEAAERDQKKLRSNYGKEFQAIAEREGFAVQPGSVTLLDEVHRRGMKTALATTSPNDLLEAILSSAGVEFRKLVDVTTMADDAGKGKPAPDVVEAAMRKLGLPKEQCVMIGDTPVDVIASRHAGIPCRAVACGRCHSAEELRQGGAAGVWDDPADLQAHLDNALSYLAPGH